MAKDFSNNPALQFISGAFTDDNADPKQPKVQPTTQERPQNTENGNGVPANLHLLDELKTKRLNLLIQPTIYEMSQKKAKATGQSTNQFIINAIIKALED